MGLFSGGLSSESNSSGGPLLKLVDLTLFVNTPSSSSNTGGRVRSGIIDSDILGVAINKAARWTTEKNLEVILFVFSYLCYYFLRLFLLFLG